MLAIVHCGELLFLARNFHVVPPQAFSNTILAEQTQPQHGRLTVRTPLDDYTSCHLTPHRWYKGLNPKTRIMIGVGVMAYAGAGLFLSDKMEEKLGLTPTEKDREELRNSLPKITTVEKGDR
jgi:hypothetical protein